MEQKTGSLVFDDKKVYVDESFSDIVPWFLDNRKEDIKRVKEFVDVSDFDQIQRMGHRWKGTCASYGFQKLSEAGELLEELAARKNKEEILQLLDRASEYVGQVDVVYVSPGDANDSNEVIY